MRSCVESGGSTSSGLLTMLLSERFAAMEKESEQAQADALREQIRKDMEKKK